MSNVKTIVVLDQDRIQYVGFFVRGMMMDHAIKTGQKACSESYEHYIGVTTSVVIAYLQGRKTLDGSCSDIQCHVAIEAKKAFS